MKKVIWDYRLDEIYEEFKEIFDKDESDVTEEEEKMLQDRYDEVFGK